MGTTQSFASFSAETSFESLPPEVVTKIKHFVLETAAAQLLGSSCRLGKTFGKQLADGIEEARLVGRPERASVRNAALYNTAIADTNDSGGGSSFAVVHHSKNVVPVGLTLSSARGQGGKALITAIGVSAECYIRLDRAIAGAHIARGHYNDGTIGTIGATITAAKLLGLDSEHIEAAIGTGAMLAPVTIGGNSMFRSSARPLTMGLAAANGILAATMTEAGVDGPRSILESKGGFADALAGSTLSDEVVSSLGGEWLLLNNYFKPFIGCRLTHVPRQGAIELREKRGLKPESIDSVECTLPAANFIVMGHDVEPGANIVEHSCSTTYLLANALLYGDNGPSCLSEERMNEPRVHDFSKRIKLFPDNQQDATFKQEGSYSPWMGRMRVRLTSGEALDYSCDFMRGDPVKWPFTEDELISKFYDYSKDVVKKDKADQVVESILGLQKIGNCDELMRLLAL